MSMMPSDRNKRHEELLQKIAMPKPGVTDPPRAEVGRDVDKDRDAVGAVVPPIREEPLRKRKPRR